MTDNFLCNTEVLGVPKAMNYFWVMSTIKLFCTRWIYRVFVKSCPLLKSLKNDEKIEAWKQSWYQKNRWSVNFFYVCSFQSLPVKLFSEKLFFRDRFFLAWAEFCPCCAIKNARVFFKQTTSRKWHVHFQWRSTVKLTWKAISEKTTFLKKL